MLQSLRASGRTVIEISNEQMDSFCGNILEVAAAAPNAAPLLGAPADTPSSASSHIETPRSSVLVMSQRARSGFTDAQMADLAASVDQIVAVAVPTIENVGGGGVRCMLAELF